jgi:transposase
MDWRRGQFAYLDRGGMRRTWLRGRENVHKRYLVHIAGHNLGILMRLLIGAGTPRQAAGRTLTYLLFVDTDQAATIILVGGSLDRSVIPCHGLIAALN